MRNFIKQNIDTITAFLLGMFVGVWSIIFAFYLGVLRLI